MSAVFITGAQTGTGYGIAEQFAKNGWDVFITSRRGPDAEKAAQKLAEIIAYETEMCSFGLWKCSWEFPSNALDSHMVEPDAPNATLAYEQIVPMGCACLFNVNHIPH